MKKENLHFKMCCTKRLPYKLLKNICLSLLLTFSAFTTFAQQKRIVHKPQTHDIIQGLRRKFIADLSNLTIDVNPGWRAAEIYDSSIFVYELTFTDPKDTSVKFLTVLIDRYDPVNFDSIKWSTLRKSIRESYGDHGIPIRQLGDYIPDKASSDSTGIIATYELLAKHEKYVEYVCAMVSKSSLILLTVPIDPKEYNEKINYIRDISGSIRIGKNK
jgi:hypothetical protein